MRPSAASKSATQVSLLTMFAKEAFSLLWLRNFREPSTRLARRPPAKSSLSPRGKQDLSGSSNFPSPVSGSGASLDTGFSWLPGRFLLPRGLSGPLLDRNATPSVAPAKSSRKGSKPVGGIRTTVAQAGQEEAVVSQEKRNVLSKSVWPEDVEKITKNLEEKFPNKEVGSAAVGNIRAMLQLGAKRAQILRLFSAGDTFYDKEHSSALLSKSEILSKFGLQSSVLFKALSKTSDWLATPDVEMAQNLEYLDKGLGVNNLGKLVSVNPHALSLPLDAIKEAVGYLHELQIADAGAAIGRSPVLLGKGKGDLESRISNLETVLQRKGSEIWMLIAKQPALLSRSSDTISESHNGLVDTFGKDSASRLIASQPQLLGMEWAQLRVPLEGLISLFTKDVAVQMVITCPLLVSRKWKGTQEKFTFLRETMGRSVEEILEWPTALTSSFDGRLQPRYEALQKQGVEKDFSLRSMFGCDDATFKRRFNVELLKKKRSSSKKPTSDSEV